VCDAAFCDCAVFVALSRSRARAQTATKESIRLWGLMTGVAVSDGGNAATPVKVVAACTYENTTAAASSASDILCPWGVAADVRWRVGGVWACGRVGVWACGRVGVWACGRVWTSLDECDRSEPSSHVFSQTAFRDLSALVDGLDDRAFEHVSALVNRGLLVKSVPFMAAASARATNFWTCAEANCTCNSLYTCNGCIVDPSLGGCECLRCASARGALLTVF
jgi:hypothetical protein